MELNRFRQLLESTMGNVKPLLKESDVDDITNYTEAQKMAAGSVIGDIIKLALQFQKLNNFANLDKLFGGSFYDDVICSVSQGGKKYPKSNPAVTELQKLINLIISFNKNHRKFITASVPLITSVIKNEYKDSPAIAAIDSTAISGFLNALIEEQIPTTTISEDGIYGNETDSFVCELKVLFDFLL